MYLYQPCLLSMALYAWACDDPKKSRWRILAPLIVLALSEWELSHARFSLYPAAMGIPMLFLWGRIRTAAWAEVLTASLLGGLICWKAADAWPLLSISWLMLPLLLLAPTAVLCRDREDRCLACAIGGLFFELFFCLREYMLFSFCVVRLGSRGGLSLGASSICLYMLLEQLFCMLRAKRRAEPAVN